MQPLPANPASPNAASPSPNSASQSPNRHPAPPSDPDPSPLPTHHPELQPNTAPPTRRAPRKPRPRVPIAADAVLSFSRYHPPPPPSPPRAPVRTAPAPPRARDAFAQANYRFLLRTKPHLPLHATASVPWPHVAVVCLPRAPTCPVCLCPPRAPRVTPCGHVFDAICLRQLRAATPPPAPAPRCPVCGARFAAHELRLCVFVDADPVQVDALIHLTLVVRKRGSVLARAASSTPEEEEDPLFSRFVVARPHVLRRLVEEDVRQLLDVLREEPALAPFVEAALEDLHAEMDDLCAAADPTVPHLEEHVQSQLHLQSYQHDQEQEQEQHKPKPDTELPLHQNAARPWFFYQSRDTQNIFLHPVNHRCLATEHPSGFAHAPPAIAAPVVQLHRHTMSSVLRRRYRFLDHLPDGCEFAFAELDLSAYLSAATLAIHISELQQRRAARRRHQLRARREDCALQQHHADSLRRYLATPSSSSFSSAANAAVSTFPSSFASSSIAATISPASSSTTAVDGRDPRSFPALQPRSIVAKTPAANAPAHADGPRVAAEPPAAAASPRAGAWCSIDGPTVLAEPPPRALEPFPALGGAAASAPHPNAPAPTPDALQGAWTGERKACAAAGGRRGRRAHRKTRVLLSNAGGAYR